MFVCSSDHHQKFSCRERHFWQAIDVAGLFNASKFNTRRWGVKRKIYLKWKNHQRRNIFTPCTQHVCFYYWLDCCIWPWTVADRRLTAFHNFWKGRDWSISWLQCFWVQMCGQDKSCLSLSSGLNHSCHLPVCSRSRFTSWMSCLSFRVRRVAGGRWSHGTHRHHKSNLTEMIYESDESSDNRVCFCHAAGRSRVSENEYRRLPQPFWNPQRWVTSVNAWTHFAEGPKKKKKMVELTDSCDSSQSST